MDEENELAKVVKKNNGVFLHSERKNGVRGGGGEHCNIRRRGGGGGGGGQRSGVRGGKDKRGKVSSRGRMVRAEQGWKG
ncbi:hypothetical protein E2C01_070971 [Portunus trituberculatus]|uniref:Uncharacterized protein n=1 Tax=Portunus trituberculatus TaxID=210409 RepID=A0A5B7I330_PORTR|nr:hypothetical protein [Portunus trituberculatus]